MGQSLFLQRDVKIINNSKIEVKAGGRAATTNTGGANARLSLDASYNLIKFGPIEVKVGGETRSGLIE